MKYSPWCAKPVQDGDLPLWGAPLQPEGQSAPRGRQGWPSLSAPLMDFALALYNLCDPDAAEIFDIGRGHELIR